MLAILVAVPAFPFKSPVTFPTIPLLNVFTPPNVWSVAVMIPGLVALAGAKFKTPSLVTLAPCEEATSLTAPIEVKLVTVVELNMTHAVPL